MGDIKTKQMRVTENEYYLLHRIRKLNSNKVVSKEDYLIIVNSLGIAIDYYIKCINNIPLGLTGEVKKEMEEVKMYWQNKIDETEVLAATIYDKLYLG